MGRLLIGLIALWVGVLAAGDAPAQQTESRIALIIANESYAGGNFQVLPGTRQDATVMQGALQRAGFTVTVHSNLNRQAMREALAGFARQLANAGDRGVGFLYYSGHGVGQRNENYLIPVDAQVQAVTDLPLQGVPLTEQLEAIQLSGARATIIVLDACRTSFGRGSRGLAPVAARTDTLIAFSTQAGEIAADDGLYARVLASEIARPGVDTVAAFARVTTLVATQTQRAQVPRFDSGLIEPIVFVSAGTARDAPGPAAAALHALDQVSSRDWSTSGGARIVRAVLGAVSLTSLQAAAADDARAQTVLAMAFATGIGVQRDDAQAAHYHRLAASQGFARAQAHLGSAYYYGRGGVAQDYAEAIRFFRLSANQGNAYGQTSLGSAYHLGEGAPGDYAEALRLFRLAADQGTAAAQARLGNMYELGHGVAQDNIEATRLYRLAADQGDAGGQGGLARMYEVGGGGLTMDRAEAIRLYRLAAEQGDSIAQDNLRRLGAN